MGADGRPVSDAVAYRDKRTKGAMEQAERGLPFPELYARTGIQKQVFNTAYQLTALQREHPEQLAAASRLLMIPEYFNYLLTGNMLNEYTNATSTALVNAYTRSWDDTVIAALGLPRRIFGPLNLPGARVGRFTGEVQGAVGFDWCIFPAEPGACWAWKTKPPLPARRVCWPILRMKAVTGTATVI